MLEPWLEPLLDAEQMRAADRWAIEERCVPSLDLMERAGAGLARAVANTATSGDVTVVCGKGNNGGDGLVAARVLREQGRDVTVLLTCDPGELRGDARVNLERLPGAPPARLADEPLPDGAAVVVDAVLGTGFSGEAHGAALTAIRRIGESDALVVAADVPSGVDASTGEVAGPAVRAAVTATFHAGKPGLWINPGKAHAGAVRTIEIGIPAGAPAQPLRLSLHRVEAVGVEHQRGLRLLEKVYHEGGQAGRAPQPRAQRDGCVRPRQPHQLFLRICRQPALGVLRQRDGHVTGVAGGDDGQHALGDGQAHQAGPAAQGGAAAQDGGPGHAAAAGHDEHAPERALVGVGGTARQARQGGDELERRSGGRHVRVLAVRGGVPPVLELSLSGGKCRSQ